MRQYEGATCPACRLTWLPPAGIDFPTCPRCGHNNRRPIPLTSTPATQERQETHEPASKVSRSP